MRLKAFLMAVALPALLAGAVLPANAREPLSSEKYINDRLVAARVADRIRRECPSISANMLRAYGAAQSLKAYAQRRGYSNDEIDAFLKDKTERKRIYAIADSYMESQGVRAGDPESYCALGRAEIAANTVTGSLLRQR